MESDVERTKRIGFLYLFVNLLVKVPVLAVATLPSVLSWAKLPNSVADQLAAARWPSSFSAMTSSCDPCRQMMAADIRHMKMAVGQHHRSCRTQPFASQRTVNFGPQFSGVFLLARPSSPLEVMVEEVVEVEEAVDKAP